MLDAGGKALGRDAPRWLEGFGQLADGSEALIGRLYDHHSVIEPYRGESLAVGDRRRDRAEQRQLHDDAAAIRLDHRRRRERRPS